jgi:hypothetical protein
MTSILLGLIPLCVLVASFQRCGITGVPDGAPQPTRFLIPDHHHEDLDYFIRRTEVLEQTEDGSVVGRLSVKVIFLHNNNWERFLYTHLEKITKYQQEAIADMLHCGDTYRSHAMFGCGCGNIIVIPYTCKGRCCSRCGQTYTKAWGDRFVGRLLRVTHRHFIFTLPDILWDLVKNDSTWKLQEAMMQAAASAMQNMFDHRFQSEKKVIPGMVVFFHPTGRDLKYNPHVHMIITEGGLDRTVHGGKGSWRKHAFWKYELLCEIWQYEVIQAFREVLKAELKQSYKLRLLLETAAEHRFENGKLGFVVKDWIDRETGKVKKIEPEMFSTVGAYLARYVRHPPIGERRLIGYDGKKVRIKYEWDNELREADVDLDTFIWAIIHNIAPKGFQMCRYYGVYANSLQPEVRWRLKGLGLKFGMAGKSGHQKKLTRNPICKVCGSEMTLLLMVYKTREGVVKRYGELAWYITML